MRIIYKALLGSALIVIVTAIAAWLVAGWISKVGVTTPPQIVTWLQHGGVGIFLWATLAKQGWNIQTWDGNTLPEKVDQWIFRSLYIVGLFCFFLSIMAAPVRSTNSEQAAAGQPATRPQSQPEGNEKPQPNSEGRSR